MLDKFTGVCVCVCELTVLMSTLHMYYQLSETQQSHEIMMTRVTLLDQEKIKLLDEQVSLERRRKDDVKVCNK